MPATYYPAVIDRSASGFGVSFPDFPGCIAAGDTPSEAAINAEAALALHIDGMVKDGDDVPDPSDVAAIEEVEGADDVARILVRVERPAKVERVLVSIERNLLRAIDAVAPNRSAFLADAARAALQGRDKPHQVYFIDSNLLSTLTASIADSDFSVNDYVRSLVGTVGEASRCFARHDFGYSVIGSDGLPEAWFPKRVKGGV